MKLIFRLLVALLISSSVFSQKIDYKREGPPYYPEQKLLVEDSLRWPLNFEISIELKDLKEISTSNDKFRAKFIAYIWSEYDKEFISKLNDTISLRHEEFITIETDENNINNIFKSPLRYYDKSDYYYLFYDKNYLKSVQLIEAPLSLNWNFRDFPFDKQELIFRFTSTVDTSIVNISSSKVYPSLISSNLRNLEDGYLITDYVVRTSYNTDESDIIQINKTEKRPIVTQSTSINFILTRNGSWLFLKLFIGGIISYLISSLMFLLPEDEFESKITLGIGAIFGAIGNRYFVDSSLPGIQVLTKADLISNLIIFMVAVNLLAIIFQRNRKLNFVYLEAGSYDFYYSIYVFFVIMFGIILW